MFFVVVVVVVVLRSRVGVWVDCWEGGGGVREDIILDSVVSYVFSH